MAHPLLPTALLLGTGLLAGGPVAADNDRHRPPPRPPQPLLCAQLAGDAGGLVGTPGIKAVTAAIVPAAGANVSFCQVDVLVGNSPQQNINVRVGLPLGPLDGRKVFRWNRGIWVTGFVVSAAFTVGMYLFLGTSPPY